MDTREAIEILQKGISELEVPEDIEKLNDALIIAISALRAQQEAEQAKEPIYPCTGCNNGWATYNSSGFTSCHGSCERLKAWWEQAKEDHNV